MGCHSSEGVKTCASDSTIKCGTGKTKIHAWKCNGACTADKCCAAATCTKSDTNPLSEDCHCGEFYDPRSDGHCTKGQYCWADNGYSYCTSNRKDSYSEKTCGDGFRGINDIVGSSTCPSTFEKRSDDDQHKGRNMDYRQCCKSECQTRLSNCNQIDSSMSVAKDAWIMPINTAGDFNVGNCCFRTQCTDWKEKDGFLCPTGKVLRNSNDHYECDDGTCDANECCKDPPQCTKDYLLQRECYCGSVASNLCKKNQYCWSDGWVCKDEKDNEGPAPAPALDGATATASGSLLFAVVAMVMAAA